MTKKKGRLSNDVIEKIKNRLLKIWSQSDNSFEKCREIVEKDKLLISYGQNWEDCYTKLKRMGVLSGSKITSRFWRAKLIKESPEFIKKLNMLLADESTSMQTILAFEELKKLGVKSEDQLRNYARREKISIKKDKPKFDLPTSVDQILKELIDADVFKKSGVDGVIKEINDRMPESKRFSKDELVSKIEGIVWNQNRGALELLKKFVRGGFDLSPVFNRLKDVHPREILESEAQRLRGVRPTGQEKKSTVFEAGIGRIATDNEINQIQERGVVELQHYSVKSPLKLPVKEQNNFKIMVICGPHLGLEYNRVIDENTLRNCLRYAQNVGVEAVIITAGLMWTDMKKSSGRLTTHRALYHGLDFDPGVIDAEYRSEAIEIRKNLPPDRISFATLRERVMNAFGGWRKVTSHKNGSPIFEGQIFFSFGYPEEEMIENSAHEHLRYLKTCMEVEARAERKAAEAELHYEMGISEGVETKEVKLLKAKVERLLRLEKRKSANTNIEKLDHKRFVDVIRSLLISWYQEAIPNSKFIGQGTVVCEIGGKKIELLQARHERPTEHDITDLIKSVGQRDLEGSLPDMILGAGPYNLNARWSARECMRDTEMDQVHVWQLPVLIDRDYVRDAKAEMIKRGSPVESLIGDWRFEPGAFMLSMVDGMWNSHPLPIQLFTQRYPKSRTRFEPPKEMIIFAEGDQHTDNPNKEYVWDERSQEQLPMEVAASEIFMREFVEKGKPLPFHIFSSHGDSTQGRHFPTEQNRHPQHESRGVLELESSELLRKIRDGEIKPNELKEYSSKLIIRLNHQIRLRGEHWYQQQMEDFVDHSIERRARFFLEILKRGKSANVKTRNIQQVLTGNINAWDRRAISRINLLDGNHGGKTTLGTVTEAWFFARILLWSVLAEKDCPFTREELGRLVSAPIFGNVASGYGLISAAGSKEEWGLHLRHDPTRKSGQDGDPLAKAARNLAERGDYGFIFNKHNFITIVGDQHRYAAAYAPGKVVFNCACSTHGDSYGDDWGFSRSNLGGLIICIPVDGPGAGPIRMIPISHVFIRQFMLKPWKIDWDRLFPNPV